MVVWSLRNVRKKLRNKRILTYIFLSSRISIIMFSFIDSKVKENANGARTFLEIVKVRFGTGAHVMFLVSFLFMFETSHH